MVPVVALLGRPNVGKSTLFNRLTGSRDALVADVPGVTRDRRYRLADHGDRAFVVVDTGGMTEAHTEIERELMRQTEQAIAEADVLVLVVDAQEGCVASDQEFHARLRTCGKPLLVAVNKVDGRDPHAAVAEFAELGANALFGISAKRGSGVTALLDSAIPVEAASTDSDTDPNRIRVSVIGRPNAGKSTLINRLLQSDRLVVSPEPGTTRDSIDVQLTFQDREMTLVDTAGIRRKSRIEPDSLEKFSVAQALRSVQRAQVAIVVIDAAQGAAEQDAALTALALDTGRAVVIALNKCDLLGSEQQAWAAQRLGRRLQFASYLPVVRTSGVKGSGLGRLLQETVKLHDAAERSFSTPEVNNFLRRAVQQNPPPRVRGGQVHIRYGHQGGNHPLRLVLHGSRVELMPRAYRRYLANRFRKAYRLPGIPVALTCRRTQDRT